MSHIILLVLGWVKKIIWATVLLLAVVLLRMVWSLWIDECRTTNILTRLELNRWSLIIGLLVVVGLSFAAWFLSPKGENQT
jgi:hypothetical protein